MAKTREITIDQNTSGWTLTDLSSAVMGTFAEYTVPVGCALIFRPQHTIYMYLEDNAATAAELAGGSPVDVQIEQPFGIGTDLLANDQYTAFKELQDVTKKRTNRITLVARANSLLKLRVKPAASVDASDCKWALQATLVLD